MKFKIFDEKENAKNLVVLKLITGKKSGRTFLAVVNPNGQLVKGGVLAEINETGLKFYRDIKSYGWPDGNELESVENL